MKLEMLVNANWLWLFSMHTEQKHLDRGDFVISPHYIFGKITSLKLKTLKTKSPCLAIPA